MNHIAAAIAPAPTPASRLKLCIQRLPTALDSSDEARTDTSSSPSMNPARVIGRGVTCGENDEATDKGLLMNPPASYSNGRRRTVEATAGAREDQQPAPKQRKYERKTKRFIWPNDLHRLFVAAIFDVGLKNASPKALLALMEAAGPNAGLTTEHLKSHLQKYRLNYERSRLEFLEYYDRSAKRILKRRRRQTQHRASGAGNEANTMFVFPIHNPKRRRRRGSDNDESDTDTSGRNPNYSSMQVVDAKVQEMAKRQLESPASGAETHPRTLDDSQLTQHTQQQQSTSSQLPLPSPMLNGRMTSFAPALASANLIPIASHHLPPAYSHAQSKHILDHDRDIAAAAAVEAVHRYSVGHLPGPVAEGAGLSALTDPQWSMLYSFMSPQLAGMTELGGDNGFFPQVTTSEARDGTAADAFMLHEEPPDLQMQMHLAMQAQMNLHRQMLTRKVEVAQHLARHSSMGTVGSTSVSSNISNPQVSPVGYRESWCNAQLLRHQSYLHQQSQDHPDNYQKPTNTSSQPSLPTARALSDTIVAASTTCEATIFSTSAASTESTMAVSSATGIPTKMKSDDDGIDLYRWDRIDLNVELDDDDLFGFLKS